MRIRECAVESQAEFLLFPFAGVDRRTEAVRHKCFETTVLSPFGKGAGTLQKI